MIGPDEYMADLHVLRVGDASFGGLSAQQFGAWVLVLLAAAAMGIFCLASGEFCVRTVLLSIADWVRSRRRKPVRRGSANPWLWG